MTELPTQSIQNQASDPWWKLRAHWLYASLLAGELRDHDDEDPVAYVVTREAIGRLALPGGVLVAADPFVMAAEPEPFVQRLGVDSADVVAARAVIGPEHDRVAALILVVGSDPIREWGMATLPGQDVSTLEHEGCFGYGVDAGTGSYGSPEAMQVVGRVLRADEGMLEDPISEALFRDGLGTRSAVVIAPEAGATPIAVCSSGWGDGGYPTWLGIDGSGNVMVAVTDFFLTADPHSDPLD